MPINLYKKRPDEADENLVDTWEGNGALPNIGYYLSKHVEENCELRLEITYGGMEKVRVRKVRRSS